MNKRKKDLILELLTLKVLITALAAQKYSLPTNVMHQSLKSLVKLYPIVRSTTFLLMFVAKDSSFFQHFTGL